MAFFSRILGKIVLVLFITVIIGTLTFLTSTAVQTNAQDSVKEEKIEFDFYEGELSDGSMVSIDGFLAEVVDGKDILLESLSTEDDGWKIVVDESIDDTNDFVLIKNTDVETVVYGDEDLDRIASLQNFKSVEPNFIYTLQYTPNDTLISSQWWITDVSSPDADIQAFEMWDMEAAVQPDVTVGVIDTGVNQDHVDLANNLVTGYDFARDQVPAYDYHGHGTHVSGIIAAEANNATLVTGVSGRNNLKVMPLRIDLSVYQIIQAIQYAESNSIKILNLSLGGEGYSSSLKSVIDNFDGLIIASAGNLSRNNDGSNPIYPASYNSGNIISVAAVDQGNNVSSYSNYGSVSVDVAAPGTSVLSTYQTYVSGSDEEFENMALITESDYVNDPLNPVGQDWDVDSNKYAIADGGVYSNNQAHSMILATPIDASGTSENANLEIAFSAVIDYSIGCVEDYLAIYVDNNDDNWTEVAKYCGTFDYLSTSDPEFYTYDIDLGVTSNALRVKVRWVTDSSGVGSRVPTIDSLILRSYSDVTDGTATMNGTSMAAPVVSGLVGMLYSADPAINPLYAKYLVTTTGDPYLNPSSRPTATNTSVNGEEMFTRLNNPADGSFADETWFESATGELEESSYPFKSSGDFDGDGVDELVAMKRISSSSMELWTYPSHGNGTVTSEEWSSFNPWYMDNTLFMNSGDFNNDGLDDVAVLYKYSSSRLAVWVFESDGTSFTPSKWMVFDPWIVDSTEFVTVGDYNNDGFLDIATFYKYNSSRVALWVFEGDGTSFSSRRWYVFDPWNINSTKFVSSGDYNNDGFDDMAAFYYYNSTRVAMWIFESDGVVMTPSRWQVFDPWYVSRTKAMTTGDFDNDGNDDLGFFYSYDVDRMALWVYESNGSVFTPNRWNVFTGLQTANLINWFAGDYLGSGVDSILGLFDNSSNDVDLVIYR
jgi:subtilisin family serine protease